MPSLVVGLGNPGAPYAAHRHNIGFMVVDTLARRAGERWSRKFHGEVARARLGGQDTLLLKPQTFMNRSGISVGAAASFYKLDADDVIVIHDELDLPFEQLRIKVGGGHAGHNGLRSIFEHFGRDFVRLRCGIGRPSHGDVSNFVLSPFSGDEQIGLDDFVDRAADAVGLILDRGARSAMNTLHATPKQAKKEPPPPRRGAALPDEAARPA